MELLIEVFNEQAERTHWLERKHPWFEILWNWTIALLLGLLLVSTIVYGIQNKIERKVEEKIVTVRTEFEAARQAEEDAEAERLKAIQASEEAVMNQEATALARAFYGIRLFVDKYGYTERDFQTYARCVFNRADARDGKISEIIAQKGQFLGYSEDNPVLDEYFSMALKFVKEWHSETTKPCDSDFQFAELLADGVWLTKTLNADGYARRWRA